MVFGWIPGSFDKSECVVPYLPRSLGLSLLVALLLHATTSLAEPSPVGTWTVTGRDELGTRWTATLFLEPKDQNEYPPTRLKGFFDWEGSNETGGREYVVLATFDYDTRVLKLHGAELEDADPNIAAAIYTVSMTKEADKLLDGTWTGESVCPGVWEATRSAEQASPKKAARSSRKAGMDSSRCEDGRCPTQ